MAQLNESNHLKSTAPIQAVSYDVIYSSIMYIFMHTVPLATTAELLIFSSRIVSATSQVLLRGDLSLSCGIGAVTDWCRGWQLWAMW